jgi:MoxR-like ATPase
MIDTGSPQDPPREPDGSTARAAMGALRDEVGKVVVGQHGTLTGLLIALLVRGHVLLEGVPGTAKTLLVKTLAASLDLDTHRLQFTPDLMPSDVVGQVVYRQGEGTFTFREGPVFTNLLLADEINRTPPKTQAALLEAMEEHQVSVDAVTHRLPDPFMVIATQNPIEYEGTYPLPEAQLDRFLFKLEVGYPSLEDELTVLARHDQGLDPHDIVAAGVRPVAGVAELAGARAGVAALRVERPVLQYVVSVVRATRESPSLALGVSPRGATALLHAAKAWAWLSGRGYVTPDEVRAMAKPALRHRLLVRPELELEGVTADGVLDGVLATVPVPR